MEFYFLSGIVITVPVTERQRQCKVTFISLEKLWESYVIKYSPTQRTDENRHIHIRFPCDSCTNTSFAPLYSFFFVVPSTNAYFICSWQFTQTHTHTLKHIFIIVNCVCLVFVIYPHTRLSSRHIS